MLIFFIVFYLLITLAIGFWASRKIKSSGDFTLAGKSLSTSFVGVTLFATWFGSSQVLANPGHFVEDGFISFLTLTITGVFTLLVVGYFYARKLYRMDLVTVGDFFRKRYGPKMDLAVSIIMVLSYPSWIAAQLVALGYLFQAVMGLPVDIGIVLGASIVILYTYVGGMWAVSYTDMLQSILILLGLVILYFAVMSETDGLVDLFSHQPRSFFRLIPSGGIEEWNDYITLLLAFTAGCIPVQEIYQRVFSARDELAARNGLYLGAFLLLVVPSIPLVIALAGAHLHPELIGGDHGQGLILSLVGMFTSLPVQILFYGAMISAILSTSSGAMLAPATVVGENLIKPYFPNLPDKRLLLFTRLSVILVAAVSCFFAFNDSDIVALVAASLSLVLVSVFVPFTAGLFWKRTSHFGAWLSMGSGAAVWLTCYVMDTQIDATIYGLAASTVTLPIGSWVRPDRNENLTP
ncbi:sodium:solute symporter family protein [Reichenbachiella ulvae]|uniref:Sodium:solute symporter family protein n=1 Tax=Reichenbachiella ulvae TaxID=2980104 RepID=A0ABT3CNN5_9BACT|nr:sodium:solute symporter family protein [Reichenbachiella ulvae]MCV9385065.1 sodium:solute symporter family protein [Reichenbachiella ulvae]